MLVCQGIVSFAETMVFKISRQEPTSRVRLREKYSEAHNCVVEWSSEVLNYGKDQLHVREMAVLNRDEVKHWSKAGPSLSILESYLLYDLKEKELSCHNMRYMCSMVVLWNVTKFEPAWKRLISFSYQKSPLSHTTRKLNVPKKNGQLPFWIFSSRLSENGERRTEQGNERQAELTRLGRGEGKVSNPTLLVFSSLAILSRSSPFLRAAKGTFCIDRPDLTLVAIWLH